MGWIFFSQIDQYFKIFVLHTNGTQEISFGTQTWTYRTSRHEALSN